MGPWYGPLRSISYGTLYTVHTYYIHTCYVFRGILSNLCCFGECSDPVRGSLELFTCHIPAKTVVLQPKSTAAKTLQI